MLFPCALFIHTAALIDSATPILHPMQPHPTYTIHLVYDASSRITASPSLHNMLKLFPYALSFKPTTPTYPYTYVCMMSLPELEPHNQFYTTSLAVSLTLFYIQICRFNPLLNSSTLADATTPYLLHTPMSDISSRIR